MRRQNQNFDNRYYPYLPSTSSSPNRNAHYQYYDPRLRTQQQTQQTLNEYQYGSANSNRGSQSFYGTPRNQYQPPAFLQELPSSSTNVVTDLGEPISIFDDIRPPEYRRPAIAPPLPSTYIPPDPSKRQSVSDVRLVTAQVLREQLLTDIERSITDIDRELTSLEHRSPVSRYVPPRFSPIAEFGNQADNPLRNRTNVPKPVSVSGRKPVPAITSPDYEQGSGRPTTKEKSNSGSQIWPNKPKRVYEVIPSLTNDSRKTSRQSSVGGQHEHIKIIEIETPQSTPKYEDKRISIGTTQSYGQYHYAPEADEREILSHDPENIDHKFSYAEIQDMNTLEKLNTDQFLRNSSAPLVNRATIFVPEFSGDSQLGQHKTTENFTGNDQIEKNFMRSLVASPVDNSSTAKDLTVHDTKSYTQTVPEIPVRSTTPTAQKFKKTPEILVRSKPPVTQETPLRPKTPAQETALRPKTPAQETPLRPKPPAQETALRPKTPAQETPLRPKPPAQETPLRPKTPVKQETSVRPITPLTQEIPIKPKTPMTQNTLVRRQTPITQAIPVRPESPIIQTIPVRPKTPVTQETLIRSKTPAAREVSVTPHFLERTQIPITQQIPIKPQMPTTQENSMRSKAPTIMKIEKTPEIEASSEIRIPSGTQYRVPSRNTIISQKLYQETETGFANQNNSILSKLVQHVRPESKASAIPPSVTDDFNEEYPSLPLATTDYTDVPSSPSYRPVSHTADNNANKNSGYFFSEFDNEGEGDEDLISIDQSNFAVPTGADIIADDNISASLLGQSRASLRNLSSEHVLQQQHKQLASAMSSNIENKHERIKSGGKKSEEIDAMKKRIATTTSILPASSPSPSQVLPAATIDDMQTQFTRNNITANDDYDRQASPIMFGINAIVKKFDQEASRSNSSRSLHRSSSSVSQTPSRVPSAKSITNDEERRSVTPTNYSVLKNIVNERIQTPERIKSSSKTLSRGQSMNSIYSKQDEEKTPINSPLKIFDREYSSNSQQSISRPSSNIRNEQYPLSRPISASLRPPSNNYTIGPSSNFHFDNLPNTATDADFNQITKNENQPNAFTVDSIHFLRSKTESAADLNQRLPSGYTIFHPDDSRISSATSTKIPVPRFPIDSDTEPLPTSRPPTPQKKNSIPSLDLLINPNVLLTTTDEPDPDDPSVINSTIHFQMLSSKTPNVNQSYPQRSQPSPLKNIVPVEEISHQIQPVDISNELLLVERHLNGRSPISHENNFLSEKNNVRPVSVSLSNQKQDEISRRTPSRIKNSYVARLEDLMGSTPSPTGSAREERLNRKNKKSISPTSSEKEMNFDFNSPRRSALSDTNKIFIEDDDIVQPTPSLSPQTGRVISPYHDQILNLTPRLNSVNQRRIPSEKSGSSTHSFYEQRNDEYLYRNDAQLSSASIKLMKQQSSPSNNEKYSSITSSQQHSKLSLHVRPAERKEKQSIGDRSSFPQTDTIDVPFIVDNKNNSNQPQRRRRVSFSSSLEHYQTAERPILTNWRERVAAILSSKHHPNEKYANVQSRVNSFANFEYQPKRIKILPTRKLQTNVVEETNLEENKFLKRKKYKVKKPKIQQTKYFDKPTNDEPLKKKIQSGNGVSPELFGKLWCLPDGSATVFHQSLEWNVPSKLSGYSFQNFNYEPQRNEFKIFNKKPKWNSESKLSELLKESPRVIRRQSFHLTNSLPIIPDRGEPYFFPEQINQQPNTERKIFDIQTNTYKQDETRFQPNYSENMSHRSYDSRPTETQIFNEKLSWAGKSKLKKTTWDNVKYKPKKSKVQIFNKAVRWNGESKIRTYSPSANHPSRTSLRNVQIIDEKLNWDAQAKIHCWSEIDLRHLTKKKAIFAQYHDPKWNDIVTARVDSINYKYPKLPNNVEIFSDRLIWTRNSTLKEYVWQNFDYKTHPRIRQLSDHQTIPSLDQTPPNRPKWNTVSKKGSVNSFYNPKITNTNSIRRGWDQTLRRKRVHKLPPLKRKRDHNDIPQLALDAPSSQLASTVQLAIDYQNDHLSTTQEQTISNGYTTSSRRSSKALVPLNHRLIVSEIELPSETARSQRPIQQEWYEDMNKSRLTQRTDMGRVTNRSFRNSIDSIHQPQTPRDLVTFRSSTRNSQNSVMSGTLLDSSIRTNRTTEFRLSKDMDEHHHHSHTPSQSMPIEIRGFKLEGTQLTVPDNATIRPLSNVSYGASERVKNRRVYPWSNLHPHGTSSRNSSLVPIAEFRRPSLDTTITETRPIPYEE